jgi:hypothetical protein
MIKWWNHNRWEQYMVETAKYPSKCFFVQHTKYEVVELEASDFTYSKMQLYVHEPSDQDPTDTFDPEFEVTI